MTSRSLPPRAAMWCKVAMCIVVLTTLAVLVVENTAVLLGVSTRGLTAILLLSMTVFGALEYWRTVRSGSINPHGSDERDRGSLDYATRLAVMPLVLAAFALTGLWLVWDMLT